ncbi:MAG: calcium/sodium antiporter [Planctomycetota bacterium]
MDILFAIILVLTGGGLLYYGGDFLVRGSSSLALRKGVSMMVVGLTVVSMGTSAPELIVSLIAGVQGNADISVGNVVGSNIANVGLVLGISALIRPLSLRRSTLRSDLPFVLATSLLLWFALLDGSVNRVDAIIMLAFFSVFMFYCFKNMRVGAEADEIGVLPKTWQEYAMIVGGIVVLFAGGKYFVVGAEKLARMIGMSDFAIGLTVVAVGTSLPELATSVIAAVRKNADISVGNVLGSNVFNLVFILGLVGLLVDLPCERSAVYVDVPVMLGVSLILLPLAYRYKLGRFGGAVLLAVYLGYIGYIFVRG